jgi:hypothetical protein
VNIAKEVGIAQNLSGAELFDFLWLRQKNGLTVSSEPAPEEWH